MRHGRLAGLMVSVCVISGEPVAAQAAGRVTGNLTILEKGGKRATDLADAVIWLEGTGAAPRPVEAMINTHDKQFLPRVLVVPAGSTVSFPNHDGFDHNVFSRSEEAPFDLGLYGRGQTRATRFARPGVVRVYCNVHAAMSAYVVVLNQPHFTQPGADGGFVLTGVPPGSYSIHAWHERGGHQLLALDVAPAGADSVRLQLDASGWKPMRHLNKFGKPYAPEGRRY